MSQLIVKRCVSKLIATHIDTNKETGRQMSANELEVKLVPQGTLVEQIRAAGAGLGGILTPTGIGTIVEEGKQKLVVNGTEYLLELPVRANVALLNACSLNNKDFKNVFEKHYTGVYRLLACFLSNRAAAEDIAQETFLKFYLTPPRELDNIGGWLMRVAKNLAFNHLHREKSRAVRESHMELSQITEPELRFVVANG